MAVTRCVCRGIPLLKKNNQSQQFKLINLRVYDIHMIENLSFYISKLRIQILIHKIEVSKTKNMNKIVIRKWFKEDDETRSPENCDQIRRLSRNYTRP